MAEIGRLLTAMVTPFDEQGQVDYEQAKRLANALLDSGSDGVLVSGTTGESPTLTTEEKLRLFSEVKDAIGDRGAVIAGTGNYNTAESIEMSQEAERGWGRRPAASGTLLQQATPGRAVPTLQGYRPKRSPTLYSLQRHQPHQP